MSCYQWALDTPFSLRHLTTAMTAAYRKKKMPTFHIGKPAMPYLEWIQLSGKADCLRGTNICTSSTLGASVGVN